MRSLFPLIVCVIAIMCQGFVPNFKGFRVSQSPKSYVSNAFAEDSNKFRLQTNRLFHSALKSTLMNMPGVGDVHFGTITDFIGSLSDPAVEFTIDVNGKKLKAKMSTKKLSPTEKLALQMGVVFPVRIADVDQSEIRVILNSDSKSESFDTRSKSSASYDDKKPWEELVKRQKLVDEQDNQLRRVEKSATFDTKKKLYNKKNDDNNSFNENKRQSGGPVSKVLLTQPEPSQLLSNLKTGTKLSGTVVSSSTYASFIDVNIYRKGRQGAYITANGMLHRDDMSSDLLTPGKKRTPTLQPGDKVDVYVKEVWKQSGRFTLTSDPSVTKSKIVEIKEQQKEDSRTRRQTRRLRRQLVDVGVGDIVSGTIQGFIPEGILISVNSLGPVTVTGLISTKSLPKQFEIPPYLTDKFQRQLLQQDFPIGRQLKTSVARVSSNPNARLVYNLKLEFEEFIDKSTPLDELSLDNVQLIEEEEGEDDEDEDDMDEDDIDDEDETDESDDINEIFNELRGDQPLLPVANLLDWADIQDMVDDNIITKNILDVSIKKIGATAEGFVTKKQFGRFISILQDIMEISPEDVDDYFANLDSEDEIKKAGIERPSASISSPDAKLMQMTEDSYEEDDMDISREIYDELCGSAKDLSVKAFKNWSDIQELVSGKLLTMSYIDEVLATMGITKSIKYEEFKLILDQLDEAAATAEDKLSSSESNPVEIGIPVKSSKKGAVSKPIPVDEPSKVAPIEMKAPVAENTDQKDTEKEAGDEEEDEEDDVRQEIFDELRGKAKSLSVKKLMEWDEVKEIVDNEILSEKEIKSIISKYVGKSNEINFEQFSQIIDEVDESASEEMEDDEEEDIDSNEIDDEETIRELFDALKGKANTVPVKTFLVYDELLNMVKEGLLTNDDIADMLKNVGATKSGDLNYEQFAELVRVIQDKSSENAGENDDDKADNEDMSGEERDEAIRELFDELRGKSAKCRVSSLLQWEELKQLMEEGLVTEQNIDEFLGEIKAKRSDSIDYEQFAKFVDILDEATDDSNIISEEEISALYNHLLGKGKSLKTSTFYDSEFVVDAIASGEMTKPMIESIVKSIAGESSPKTLTKEQFSAVIKAMTTIDEDSQSQSVPTPELPASTLEKMTKAVEAKNKKNVKAQATSQLKSVEPPAAVKSDAKEEEEEEDGDSFDELSDEDLEEMRKEIFEELKSKKTGLLSVNKLVGWDTLRDFMDSEEFSKADILAIVKQVGGDKDPRGMTYEQFKEFVSIIDESDNEEDEGEKVSSKAPPSGKGFAPVAADGKPAKPSNKVSDKDAAIDGLTREMYDGLRGKKPTVSVKQFEMSKDMQQLIKSGGIKQSTFDRAINKVGSNKEGQLTYEQFNQVLDIIQSAVDISTFKDDLMNQDDDEEEDDMTDNDDDDEGDELERETAKELFDELCNPKKNTVSLVDFLKWEEVQNLQEAGALTNENLALAISEAGVTKDKPEMKFEQFFELLQVMDKYIDESKVLDDEFSGDDSEDDEALFDGVDEDSEEEIQLMFKDLSKGKDFVSEKDLRKWPDMKEMVDAGLITQNTLDKYLSQVKFVDGKASYDEFKKLVSLIDTVLVDSAGNILDIDDADKAVKLPSEKPSSPKKSSPKNTTKSSAKPAGQERSNKGPSKGNNSKLGGNKPTNNKPKRK